MEEEEHFLDSHWCSYLLMSHCVFFVFWKLSHTRGAEGAVAVAVAGCEGGSLLLCCRAASDLSQSPRCFWPRIDANEYSATPGEHVRAMLGVTKGRDRQIPDPEVKLVL